MNKLIDKILTEWSYRVHDGMPNPSNPMHLVHLEKSLNEFKLPRKVSQKLLQNLKLNMFGRIRIINLGKYLHLKYKNIILVKDIMRGILKTMGHQEVLLVI